MNLVITLHHNYTTDSHIIEGRATADGIGLTLTATGEDLSEFTLILYDSMNQMTKIPVEELPFAIPANVLTDWTTFLSTTKKILLHDQVARVITQPVASALIKAINQQILWYAVFWESNPEISQENGN